MADKIKWGFIQPLTGGAFLGAEEAIGCPASWVLSFPGLCAHTEKDGKIKSAANEYHLMTYLKKKDRLPPYLTINRDIFANFEDDPNAFNPEFIENDFSTTKTVDLSNTDIVCALPVCSGLSNATNTSNDETRQLRNNNMKWITKYVLGHIKPKAYIFENAPALFAGDKGKPIREFINKVALEEGYSVSYFKTDTMLHHNAQRRPRTFVICWKWTGTEKQMPPIINFIEDKLTPKQFFDEMPKYDQMEPIEMGWFNEATLAYMKQKFPNDWRQKMTERTSHLVIVEDGLVDDYCDWCQNVYQFDTEEHRASQIKAMRHAKEKHDAGSWIFDTTPACMDPNKPIPSIMHKVTIAKLHPFEDRLLNVGEILYCMGMPTDYWIYGETFEKTNQTGQNVPVKTMKYIVSEIVRVIKNWDTERTNTNGNPFFGDDDNVEYVDNTKQYCTTKEP